MKKYLFVFSFFLSSLPGFSQSPEDSVKMVVNKMFAAMKSANATELQACFADSAILQTITRDKAGKASVRNEEIADFVNQIASLPKDAADERITFETVKVDADLAIAWTPYQFYFKNNFSHCGVNSFQLVRINGQWKIQYIIDTRRKDNCR